MNQIQVQAKKYAHHLNDWQPVLKDLVRGIREQISIYNKLPHKVEFLEEVIREIRREYDRHLNKCDHVDKSTCIENQRYEMHLFFLQNELDELNKQLPSAVFTTGEKAEVIEKLNEIIKELRSELHIVKTGQQVSYDNLFDELQLIKNFMWMDKKSLTQLIMGKLADAVGGGVVGATVTPEILDKYNELYKMIMKV